MDVIAIYTHMTIAFISHMNIRYEYMIWIIHTELGCPLLNTFHWFEIICALYMLYNSGSHSVFWGSKGIFELFCGLVRPKLLISLSYLDIIYLYHSHSLTNAHFQMLHHMWHHSGLNAKVEMRVYLTSRKPDIREDL